MAQENASQLSPLTTNIFKYKKPSFELGRWWEVHYVDANFYLTDNEHHAFIRALNDGMKSIQVGDVTLSEHFLYIQRVDVKPKNIIPDYEEITLPDGSKVFREK